MQNSTTNPSENPPVQKHARLLRIGIAAFIVLALFWLGYVPERRDRVFRALPANTVFASEHLNLAKVWRSRFDNPLIVGTLAGAGVDNVADWSSDTNIVWIVRLVSGRRSLIAWSPALGPSATPSWMGASWAGFRGPLLRTLLFVRWVPGLGRLQTTPLGTRYLDTASKKAKARGESGPMLAFSLRENVLLATLGEDPDAVRAMDWRLTHDAPLAPLFADDPQPWRKTGQFPHRAWVDASFSPVELPIKGTVEARLLHIRGDRLGLSAILPTPRRQPSVGAVDEVLAGRCTAADSLASDDACALLMLPGASARNLINTLLPGLPITGNTAPTGEDAALYINTKPLGGRLFNLAVPSLTLLYPGPAGTAGVMTQSVDQVARATHLKLRTYEPAHNMNGRLLIDWMGGSKHIRLTKDDCVAAEIHPGWLTLCTSAASLDAQRGYAAEEKGAWRGPLAEQTAAAGTTGLDGYLWIDLGRTTYELRQIHAVYRLATALGAIRVTEQESAAMARLKQVLDTLAINGSLAVAWRSEANTLRIDLDLRAQ
jgi:hypothetical protein